MKILSFYCSQLSLLFASSLFIIDEKSPWPKPEMTGAFEVGIFRRTYLPEYSVEIVVIEFDVCIVVAEIEYPYYHALADYPFNREYSCRVAVVDIVQIASLFACCQCWMGMFELAQFLVECR